MRIIALLFFFQNSLSGICQDTVFVHFLYGSKPARGYKHIESHWFGGIHGGHVSIQAGKTITGFEPEGRCHIFPQSRKKHSHYLVEDTGAWREDTAGMKYLTIAIP